MKLRTRIGLLFAGGFGVIALAAVASWVGADVLLDTTREVRGIHERLEAFDAVLGDMVDAETGARGFVITGQESFLEPYEQAARLVPRHLARLAELLVEHPAQLVHLGELLDVEGRRLARSAEVIRVRREAGADAASALVAAGSGRSLMKELRRILGELRSAETARLAELTARGDRRAQQATEIILGSAIVMAVLVLIGVLVLTRSITRPIGALALAAKRISDGQWPPIARERADEIGDLADALSAMATARRRAEERLRALLDHAPDAVFVADLEGRYTDANVAATELVGYGRDELISMTIMDLIPADERQRLAGVRKALLETGTVDIAEWSLLRKDGTRVPVEVSAKILRDGRWQAFVRDISERKRAQAERDRLLENERELRRRLQAIREAVLAISPLATTSSTTRGHGTLDVVRSIVERARQLTSADFAGAGVGTGRDSSLDTWVWSGLAGAEAAVIGDPPQPSRLLATDDAGSQPGSLEGTESPAQPTGQLAIEALLTVPLEKGVAIGKLYLGKRLGSAPFTSDDLAIVELLVFHAAVAIENAKLYDEVQAAVAAREELLATVSHDLKNPLNAVMLREELLLRKHPDDREVAEHGRGVRRAVGNMQRLIRDLLDAASLDAGRLVLDIEPSDVCEIVDDVIDALGPIAAETGIAIECRAIGPHVAHFDRQRLSQVMYNLISNALRFTSPRGRITIDVQVTPAELQVTVADTGRGIPPEVLPHIFERYFTTEHGRRGTGLGLHIAQGVIAAHGGRIWATSTPGMGATFHFTVPTRAMAGAVPDRRPEEIPEPASLQS